MDSLTRLNRNCRFYHTMTLRWRRASLLFIHELGQAYCLWTPHLWLGWYLRTATKHGWSCCSRTEQAGFKCIVSVHSAIVVFNSVQTRHSEHRQDTVFELGTTITVFLWFIFFNTSCLWSASNLNRRELLLVPQAPSLSQRMTLLEASLSLSRRLHYALQNYS